MEGYIRGCCTWQQASFVFVQQVEVRFVQKVLRKKLAMESESERNISVVKDCSRFSGIEEKLEKMEKLLSKGRRQRKRRRSSSSDSSTGSSSEVDSSSESSESESDDGRKAGRKDRRRRSRSGKSGRSKSKSKSRSKVVRKRTGRLEKAKERNWKSESHREQFKTLERVLQPLQSAKARLDKLEGAGKAKKDLEKGEQVILERLKLLMFADEKGWQAAKIYDGSLECGSDSEDERRMRMAAMEAARADRRRPVPFRAGREV